jgi:hypothetical protein
MKLPLDNERAPPHLAERLAGDATIKRLTDVADVCTLLCAVGFHILRSAMTRSVHRFSWQPSFIGYFKRRPEIRRDGGHSSNVNQRPEANVLIA